jgi:arylsulfatase A-like enzyme
MIAPSLRGTTTFELMHVVDMLPTIVEIAGGDASSESPHPLDGVSQTAVLLEGGASARADLLINIERSNPTTAPSSDGKCDGVPQYAVIKGQYKLLVGGGGTPNVSAHVCPLEGAYVLACST